KIKILIYYNILENNYYLGKVRYWMRKKVKMIINPSSGRQNVESRIDLLSKMLLDDGYIVAKHFTKKKDDAMYETIETCNEDWDIIIACGGDGTVNEIATGIAKSDNK